MKNVQLDDKPATTATKPAISQTRANKQQENANLETSSTEDRPARPKQEHVHMLQQEENLCYDCETVTQHENCFSIQDTTPTSSPFPMERGHFIQLTLADSNFGNHTQIPFQIDSAASCNTLPSRYLSKMPWAKLQPTTTVIMPYASPPINPIGKITLKATRGTASRNLTLQVVDTDQPALLSTEASKSLSALAMNADFVRKCTATDRANQSTQPLFL